MMAVRADRKQQTVAACLRARPEPLRRPIKRTGTEMSEGCVNALTAEIPWAEIVLDRFPVARASRDGADTVRQRALKRLTHAVPKAE